MDEKRKEKLAIWCNVPPEHVISAPDVASIYDVPLNFGKDDLGDQLLDALSLSKDKPADFHAWSDFVSRLKGDHPEVSIGIVGKYFDTGDFVLSDAYLSVIEALKFSGAEVGVKPKIEWVNSKDIEKNGTDILAKYDGILVPGGFGQTGIEGKIMAIEYAREHKVPYFGLCYGMQLMVVEYARHKLGLAQANTVEIDPETPDPIVAVMESQKEHLAGGKFGGTMRLGSYVAKLKEGSVAATAYGSSEVTERHRHRYEINNAYVERLTDAGLVFSGTSPDGVLMEIAELPASEHPFFLGTQFHPELIARPLSPHPLFTTFLKASSERA
jgi:CTP synthase